MSPAKSPHIAQKIADLRAQLARPCTAFEAGGFRPSGSNEESWIGRVFLCRPEETGPVRDAQGQPLHPLAQFYLPALPFVPEDLRHVTWLTVFMGEDWPEVWNDQDRNGQGWLLREYTAADTLVPHEYPTVGIKPFPLKPMLLAQDFPLWDGGGADHLSDAICALEPPYPDEADAHTLKYYDDIATAHSYAHKFGGYPSFCQSGICHNEGEAGLNMGGSGFRFMFQISSDAKAGLNVVDSGSLMFSRHPGSGEWSLYYDFY